MIVERVKYVIWAADMERAVHFYCQLFGGRVLKHNSVIAEVEILGSVKDRTVNGTSATVSRSVSRDRALAGR